MIPMLRHFGLNAAPFALTPNPQLYLAWEHPQAIMSGIEYALTRGDGILHLGGAVGSGKTLMCHLLLARLDGLQWNTAYLNGPLTDAEELPTLVLQEFGVKLEPGMTETKTLENFLLRELERGRRNILVIDEAQALGAAGLESLRQLSNLETDTHKLLQIVIVGNPELEQLLLRPDMQQLAQRIPFHFATKPIPNRLIGDYLRLRLQRCTDNVFNADIFDFSAIDLLGTASQGLPRLLNLLADKAMLAAYATGQGRVTRQLIRAAIMDTGHLALPMPWRDKLATWRRAA
jgi:MSHA biogenesis protein MshM